MGPFDRQIWLNREYYAVVSAPDYFLVSQHVWSVQLNHAGNLYARRRTGNTKFYMHRVIACAPPKTVVDHRNGIGLDNRRQNLLVGCFSRNNQNRCYFGGVGFKGVCRDGPRFRARISVFGERESLGNFATAEEAARVYDRRALEAYGPFADVNFRTFG